MKFEKIIKSMRNNKRDWKMKDLISVGESLGMSVINNGTSHFVFRYQGILGNVSIPKKLDIHPDYITQFLRLIDKITELKQPAILQSIIINLDKTE